MEIRRENYCAEAVEALTAALEAELLGRYDGVAGAGAGRAARAAALLGRSPGGGGAGPAPAAGAFEPPDGVFLVLLEEGEAVACGGVSRYEGTTAELRRMRARSMSLR